MTQNTNIRSPESGRSPVQKTLSRATHTLALLGLTLGLAACGGGGGSGDPTPTLPTAPATPTPPTAPATPTLSLTYGAKSYGLQWAAVAAPAGGGNLTYRVIEDSDGDGPVPPVQIAAGITGTRYDRQITGPLYTQLNARFQVQACNDIGCSLPSVAETVSVAQAIGYFKASNPGSVAKPTSPYDVFGDWFGSAVALSGDGNTLAVGAVGEDSSAAGVNADQADNAAPSAGAVYVFTRESGTWVQQAYVKASNPKENNSFGLSVALSQDGSTLAVGARAESSNATGINGSQTNSAMIGSGAVYVFTRGAGTWRQQAYVKVSNTKFAAEFGIRVALSSDGNTLAVGATGESSRATGINGDQADNSAFRSGAVYVFARKDGSWGQQAYIKASNTKAYDAFGSSLALSGDGNTLAVGAIEEDSQATGINGNQSDYNAQSSGAVYVFSRSSITWSQQAYVKSSNTGTNFYFGTSVALSGDGNTLAVGAPLESSSATGVNGDQTDKTAFGAGAVYTFVRSAGAWSQQNYLKASNTAAHHNFGHSVALSGDGATLAVGAPQEASSATGMNGNQADRSAFRSGALYVFERSSNAWSQKAYLKASNTASLLDPGRDDLKLGFGAATALSSDGNTLAVGAPSEAGGSKGINGNQADKTAPYSGAVYLY